MKLQSVNEVQQQDYPTGVVLLKDIDRRHLSFSINFMNDWAKKLFLLQAKDYTNLKFEETVSETIFKTFIPLWGTIYDKSKPDLVLKRLTFKEPKKNEILIYVARIEGGNLILLHEIQDHVKETLRLRNIARKYRSIFENSQDVFYQTSVDGTILEISPSVKKYTGFNRNEMIGREVSDFYVEPGKRHELIKTLQKTGRIYDYEIKFRTKSGAELYVSTNAHLVRDANGDHRIEGALRNITRRKVAEIDLKKSNLKLQQLNAQKNKLFSVISHDLKNAISGPAGILDLIIEDYEDLSKNEVLEYLKVMSTNTHNAIELLFDLLSWAKNQFQEVDPYFTDVEMIRLMEQVISQQTPIAAEKGIKIENNLSDYCTIQADEDMLKTIFRNLISNAIKFTNSGGKIIVGGEKSSDKIQIYINDNGVGMKPEILDKIFDKASNYTTKGTGGERGSGLGLDLSADFVAKHNGKLWAESNFGEGSTFYVELPVKQET